MPAHRHERVDARPVLNVLGSSFIARIAITDAIYGLTVVDETTSPVYWYLAGVMSVLFLLVVALRQQLRPRHLVAQIGLSIAWVAIGYGGYAFLNAA
ncbi:MAG: DUF6518 family protein [Nocardioidaceae bacterium]